MAQLLGGLDDAAAGRGRLFLLSGEPGIGKSRLADELAARAEERGAEVLWGRSWEAGGAPAYWPWVQALRSHVRDLDPKSLRAQLAGGASDLAQMLPEVRELFAGLPPPPSTDPETARFRLFDATATFLRKAARARPLLLLLDDLHAADASSLLLLQFVAGELGDAAILLVGSYRDTELTREHPLTMTLADLARRSVTRRIGLVGLGEAEVSRFLALGMGRTAPAALVAAVHAETEGNPLFVVEMVRLLAEEAPMERGEDLAAWRLTVPQGIREFIARRLARLSDECASLLALASVLGRQFDLDALNRVAGRSPDELLDVLGEAVAARIVTDVPDSPGRLRFSHALVREALYDDIPPTRRLRLHRQVGEALEVLYADPDPHVAELAHHFFQAAPAGQVGKAVDYCRRAAERALRLLAYEESIRLSRMALRGLELEESPEQEERCELLLGLGEAQARAGHLAAAKETFLAAAELAGRLDRPEALARAALGYGGRFVWGRAGDDPHLVPLLEDAIAAVGRRDSVLRVMVLARLSGALRGSPDRGRCDALSAEAVEVARRLGDPTTLAYALDGRIGALLWPENPEQRLELASELVRVSRQAGDMERTIQGHHWRLVCLMELGDLPGVRAELETKALVVGKLRQPSQRWYLGTVEAVLKLFEGRFDQAERLIEEAVRLGQRSQWTDAEVAFRLQTYGLRREQGRVGEVEGTIRRSVDDYPWYPMFRCILAHLHAELGREREARAELDSLAAGDFAALPRDSEWLFGMSFLPEVTRFLRDRDRASTLYDLLLPFGGRNVFGAPELSTGASSRYLGILASTLSRWDEAARHFEDALAMNERMEARPWTARTQHDYARMLLARDGPGDRALAGDLLGRAMATARDLRMPALEREVSALLEQERHGAGPEGPAAGVRGPNVFRREGDYWTIAFQGQRFRLHDSKGLRHLALLLANAGREIPALELAAAGDGSARVARAPSRRALDEAGLHPSGPGGAGEALDARARAQYRARLEELEENLEEAERWADSERAARAREEREFIAAELGRALGLGGSSRRGPSPGERARSNVTKAIKAAVARIAEQSPELGRHLRSTVRTGTFCSYTPDPRVPPSWVL